MHSNELLMNVYMYVCACEGEIMVVYSLFTCNFRTEITTAIIVISIHSNMTERDSMRLRAAPPARKFQF